ncbi:MAG: hypothetical protein IPN92_20865 [Chromatiaceae bacterium]|nr:hypothetical protein [Chromatiaceae bacterium]
MIVQATKALVKSRLGLSFEGQGEQPLRRAIERRLAATRATGATANRDYVARLALDTEELDALTSLLTINETYFTASPSTCDRSPDHLAPEVAAHPPAGQAGAHSLRGLRHRGGALLHPHGPARALGQ